MPRETWIGCQPFAELAGITRQVANRLCRATCERAVEWRGVQLTVRTKRGGKGGRSGIRYEVAVSSLPADLKDRLKGLRSPLQGELNLQAPAPGADEQIRWWSHHVRPLLAKPKGPERSAAVDALADQVLLDWKNRPRQFSRATIYGRLRRLEGEGVGRPAAQEAQRRRQGPDHHQP